MRLRLSERQLPHGPRFGSPPGPLRTGVDAKVPLALEPLPAVRRGARGRVGPRKRGKLRVLVLRAVLDRDGQSQGHRTPRTPRAKAKCPGTAVPKRAREAGLARETPPTWRRSARCPPESYCALQISVLGSSAGLCLALPGSPPPGPAPPREAAGGLPRTPRPLSPTRRHRSGSWLARGNWPALSPQNSAGILGAWKWVNKA